MSRVPRPPLDGLIDDLYYLQGVPPYPKLTLPPTPSAVLILNLGAPFRIRAGGDDETAEYADGCVVTTPTRALEFGYPPETRSVGVHFKPWGLAPFLPMPAAELCDRPVTVEQVWGRPASAELRDRLATATGPRRDADAARRRAAATAPRDRRPRAGPPHEQRHRGGHGSRGDRRAEQGGRRQQHPSGAAVQGARSASRRSGWPAPTASPPPRSRSIPPHRSTGSTSPIAPATTTRPTSATISERSRG